MKLIKKNKERKINEKRLAIKLALCIVYLVVITILFVCSYNLFNSKNKIVSWSEVENIEDYTYMEISKMSEKFAYYKEANIGIHFVIEKEETGQWHTYLIAIDESTYDKYKDIIDYTYERTDKQPEPIKIYGYPVNTPDEIKDLAIKNIDNFVPASNEVKITKENFNDYLTNSYLDTTKSKEDNFNILLFTTLVLLVIVIILFIITLLDRDKIVDNIDEQLDKEIKRVRDLFIKK